MKEDLLHFIWRYRLYDSFHLKTTEGEAIEVIHPGTFNTDAGADFSNARIRIGTVLLAGNVELHVEGRDWYHHQHHQDKAYNNVILHVVFEDSGREAVSQSGHTIPVLSLRGHVSAELLHRYDLLKASRDRIPCQTMIRSLPEDFPLASFYDRLVIERLQSKVSVVEGLLAASTGDWDQVAFRMIAMYIGGPVNKEPFGLLASSLPLSFVHRHRDQAHQVEALLYGQAGLLDEDHDDEYPQMLKREYNYLRKLHSLQPIGGHLWRFFRVRPAGFPTVKIAQLAAWLLKVEHPFDAVLNCRSVADLRGLFDAEVHRYWQSHFQFDKPVRKANGTLGNMLSDVLLINAVGPLLFSYGRYKDDEALCQRALDLLAELPAESNAIVRMWGSLGIHAAAATDSQAQIQLHDQYCLNKRCLSCQIGHKILSPKTVSVEMRRL